MRAIFSNLSLRDIELSALAVYFVLMWLAERNKYKKASLRAREKRRETKSGSDDLPIDFASISSQLSAIHQFVMSAVEIGSKDGLAKALVDLALRITKSEEGCVLLPDASRVELVTSSNRGFDEEAIRNIKIKLSKGIPAPSFRPSSWPRSV